MEKNKIDNIPNIDVRYTELANLRDLWGMFRTVSAAPTNKPRKVSEQIVIYRNGATKRIYVYDPVNDAWGYVALT